MNVPQRFLILDGIHIPLYAAETITQTLDPITEGKHLFRTMGGNLNKQTHWQALTTTISSTGNVPHGLNGIDFTQSYQIHCIKSRSVRQAAPNFTVERQIRLDIPPLILAHTGNLVARIPVLLSGQSISAVPVPGTDFYTLSYYPIITVISDEPTDSLDLNSDVSSWTLTAEEIASVD